MHWSVSQAADVQLKILVLLWVGARTGKGTDLGANEGEVCNFSSCPVGVTVVPPQRGLQMCLRRRVGWAALDSGRGPCRVQNGCSGLRGAGKPPECSALQPKC